MSTALPTFIGLQVGVAGSGDVNMRTDISGAVPGDFLVAVVESHGGDACSIPSGWTEVADSPQAQGTGAGSTRITVFYKWADFANVQSGATTTITDTGNHTYARCYAFRGVNEVGAAWDVTSGGTDATSNTSLSVTGDTTTVDNCMVLVIAGNCMNDAAPTLTSITNADLANLTDRDGVQSTNLGGFTVITGEKATAGAYGATTGTYSSNTVKAFLTLALKPADTPWIQAIGALVGGTSGLTVSWPTHATNDVGLLFVESAGGEPVTFPGGWTALASSPQATGAGTAGTQLSVAFRRATSSSEGTAVFSDPGDHIMGFILTVRNCEASANPINATSGGVKASASTSVTITGTTTTITKALVLAMSTRDNDSAAAEYSAWADASLANVVEGYDAGLTFGNGGGFGMARGVLAAPGPTGDTTANTTNSVVNAFVTIALRGGGSVGSVGAWAAIIG